MDVCFTGNRFMRNPLGARKYKGNWIKQVQSQLNSQKQLFGGLNHGEIQT